MSIPKYLAACALSLAFAQAASAQSIGGEVVEAMTAQPLRTYQVRLFYLAQGDSTRACDSAANEVQQVAIQRSDRAIRYPGELKSIDMTGEVLARFIVDPTGMVRPGSLTVIRSSHPLFTKAVVDGLRLLRFHPARVGGIPVAQLVEEPFTFTLERR
jgi:TonB family protein